MEPRIEQFSRWVPRAMEQITEIRKRQTETGVDKAWSSGPRRDVGEQRARAEAQSLRLTRACCW